jgi:nickel-dependent lactate racemase
MSAAVARAMEIVGRARHLTVVLNDPQRHTDSRAVLSCLSRHVAFEGLRILVATGTHRFGPQETSAFAKSLGGGMHTNSLAWHDCRAGDLVSVGGIWRGHPWLLEETPVLAVGSVEPHYFAGFTGTHKTCTIGCAAFDDIQSNHAHALSADSRPCRLDGNPVHEGVAEMLAALEGLRPIAAINVVQIGARIVAAVGGSCLGTLEVLRPSAADAFVRTIPEPADALVLEVAGPLGQSFYQADKGIKNSESAVRDGGCMVLVAPCRQGIGQDAFVDLLREASGYESAMAILKRRGYRLGDHKAVRLRRLTDPRCRNVRIFVVSHGLSDDDARLLGMTRTPTVQAALGAAGVDGGRDRVYRVRDAGNLCVRVEAVQG